MAHPSEYYIKYLIAKRWPLGDDQWKEFLQELDDDLRKLDLPGPTNSQAKALRDDFTPPKTFRFNDKTHQETVEFMQANKIYTLWRPGEDERKMLNLLAQHRLQFKLRVLLMGDVVEDQIVDSLSKSFGTGSDLSVKIIQIYKHYIWNYNRVSDTEWFDLLHRNVNRDQYLAAIRCSQDQAMWRAGFEPKVEGKEALKDAYRIIHFRLEATRWMTDTKETAEITAKYAKELVGIYNTLFAEGAGFEEMLKRFSKFLLVPEEQKIKALAEIASEGSHSESGK